MQIKNESGIWSALAEPFLPRDVNLRILAASKDKSRGLVAPYVHARTIMIRLDDVVGVEGWQDHYESIGERGENVFVRCSLTICGITKEDVGGGVDYKAACSDALKRAAVKFGIGRHLYAAERVWAQLEGKGAVLNKPDVKRRILATTTASCATLPEAAGPPSNGQTL